MEESSLPIYLLSDLNVNNGRYGLLEGYPKKEVVNSYIQIIENHK